MVYTRVTADADQAPLLKSLQAVAEHPMMYIVSGIARAISGLTMLVAGWLLLHTWIIRGRWATPIVPYLFVLSGSFTVASGAFAILIAFSAGAGGHFSRRPYCRDRSHCVEPVG